MEISWPQLTSFERFVCARANNGMTLSPSLTKNKQFNAAPGFSCFVVSRLAKLCK